MPVALDSADSLEAWARVHFNEIGFDDYILSEDRLKVNSDEVMNAWAFIHSPTALAGLPAPNLWKVSENGMEQLSVWYTSLPVPVTEDKRSKPENQWRKIWAALQYELGGRPIETIPNPFDGTFIMNFKVETMRGMEAVMRKSNKFSHTIHPDFQRWGRENMTEKKYEANIATLVEARKVRVEQQKQEADERALMLLHCADMGFSHEQIAEKLDIKVESVRVELWRAQKRMKAPEVTPQPEKAVEAIVAPPVAIPEPAPEEAEEFDFNSKIDQMITGHKKPTKPVEDDDLQALLAAMV